MRLDRRDQRRPGHYALHFAKNLSRLVMRFLPAYSRLAKAVCFIASIIARVALPGYPGQPE
jgi:hypothetical protein